MNGVAKGKMWIIGLTGMTACTSGWTLPERISEYSQGGTGAGLLAFTNATIEPGIQLVATASRLASRARTADVCITGEGRIDGQTAYGKTHNSIPSLFFSLLSGPGLPGPSLFPFWLSSRASATQQDCHRSRFARLHKLVMLGDSSAQRVCEGWAVVLIAAGLPQRHRIRIICNRLIRNRNRCEPTTDGYRPSPAIRSMAASSSSVKSGPFNAPRLSSSC